MRTKKIGPNKHSDQQIRKWTLPKRRRTVAASEYVHQNLFVVLNESNDEAVEGDPPVDEIMFDGRSGLPACSQHGLDDIALHRQ